MAMASGMTPERQPKHEIIMEATEKVFVCICGLEQLINEIKSATPEAKEKLKTSNLSLSVFLNAESNRLNEAAERINKATDQLREILL